MTKTVYAKPFEPARHYAELAKWRTAWNGGEQGHFVKKMIALEERTLRDHGFNPDSPPAEVLPQLPVVTRTSCPNCGHTFQAMPVLRAPGPAAPYVGGDAVRLQQNAGFDQAQTKFAALNSGALTGEPEGESAGELDASLFSPPKHEATQPSPGANLTTDEQLAPDDPILREVWNRPPVPKQGGLDTTTPDDPAPVKRGTKKK